MAGNTTTRTYTLKIKRPHVGDIVKYTPDTPSDPYKLSSAQSGASDQTFDSSYDPTTWKLMELSENGNVLKLFGVPNSNQGQIEFGTSIGYNTGVYLLNDICAYRYSNASLGATARNIQIEDIEERMNSNGLAARNSYKSSSIQYGTTRRYSGSNIKYPSIYTREKYSGVGVRDIADGTQIVAGSVNSTALAKMNPSGKTQSENMYIILPTTSETTGIATSNLTSTQTYYSLTCNSSNKYFDDENFRNMIFGTGTSFWFASRSVRLNNTAAYFGIRGVYEDSIDSEVFIGSDGSELTDNSNHLAPVVTVE